MALYELFLQEARRLIVCLLWLKLVRNVHLLSLAAFKYTLDQIRRMEESNQIRKAAEPTELIEMVR